MKKLIMAFEEIGFDEMDMFDHVVMGYPTQSRKAPFYPPQMPIMEAMTMLSFAAAITEKILLGTSVLVLPQRQAMKHYRSFPMAESPQVHWYCHYS